MILGQGFIAIAFAFFAASSSFAAGNYVCSVDNEPQITSAPAGMRVVRLANTCDGSQWDLLVKGRSSINLPPQSRVVVLEQNSKAARVAGWIDGKITDGWVDTQAVNGDKACPRQIGAEAFINEARLAVDLSKNLLKVPAKEFADFLTRTDQRLLKIQTRYGSHLQSLQARLEAIAPSFKKEIASHPRDKVETLSRISRVIYSNLNPIEIPETDGQLFRVSERTIIVPISREWFDSTPDMQSYFDREFLRGGFDIKFASGTSGEGIHFQQNDKFDEFTPYVERFKKLNHFVQSQNSKKVLNSSEASWLMSLVDHHFGDARRMIFIHAGSWKAQPESLWADYIPIDQSLGGMPRSRLFSVLMHEINVNMSTGGYYFPTDTHSPDYDTYSLWKCVGKHGIGSLKADYDNIRRFLAIQPPMSLLYLSEIENLLENEVAN